VGDADTVCVRPPARRHSRSSGCLYRLRPYERGDLDIEAYLADIPYVATGGGNAYNDVHYERPIRVGDDLIVEVTFTDVFEKSGRAGTLLFRRRKTRYTTAPEQGGELVANTVCAHVRAFDTIRRTDDPDD
jgi:hypothetical protein